MGENVEIKRILDIIKAKIIIIVLILISFILLGYMYTYNYVKPEYMSTESLLLMTDSNSENKAITNIDLTLNSELIDTYSNIAKQSKVLKQVIYNLKLNMTEKELLNKLKIETIKDTYIIKVSVKDADAQQSAQITGELSNVFLNEIQSLYNLNNIGIIDEAKVPIEPYNINHMRDFAIFIVIGIIAISIYIGVIYVIDNTIKTEKDVEKYVKIKTLGKVPVSMNKKVEIINTQNAKSYVNECINTIRTNILYMSSMQKSKTILITSYNSQEGKSWISANITASFAEMDKKVLIIDADMRKGRANKIFNVPNTEGLSNYLCKMTGNVKEDLNLAKKYIKETEISNLHILTRGVVPPNPSELIDSSNMKQLIKMFKEVYDIIIIDAPPCNLVTDSVILSTMIDSTVLIASAEKTKINELQDLNKAIQRVGGNVIGVILNKVKMSGKIYSNGYYGRTDSENKCEVKPKEKLTVDVIINQTIQRLEEEEYMSLRKEDIDNIKENQEIDNEPTYVLNDAHIEDVITNKMQELQYNSIMQIGEQIKRLDYKESLSEITKQLENIKEIANDSKYNDNIILKLEQMQEITKKQDYSDKIMLNIDRMQENIKQEISKLDNTEQVKELKEIVSNQNYAEELSKIITELEKIKLSTEDSAETDKILLNLDKMNESFKQEMNRIDSTEQVEKLKEIILNQNYTAKIDEVKEALEKQNHVEELSRIITEIEQVKLNTEDSTKIDKIMNNLYRMQEMFRQKIDMIDNTEQVERLKEIVLNQNYAGKIDEVKESLEKQNYVKELSKIITELEKVKLNTEDKTETDKIMLNLDRMQKNVLQEIYNIDNIVDPIRLIITQEIARVNYTQKINEIAENLNYTEQIKQINENILNLKESYEEILSKLEIKNDAEISHGNNIIDLKLIKEQFTKKKKKTVFSLNEDISYEELQETACCVIPLTNNKSDKSNVQSIYG